MSSPVDDREVVILSAREDVRKVEIGQTFSALLCHDSSHALENWGYLELFMQWQREKRSWYIQQHMHAKNERVLPVQHHVLCDTIL